MRSLRAISFTPRQRHCYFLLDAFAGQAAFLLSERRAVPGQRRPNIALRLLGWHQGRLMQLSSLPPQPDGVFRVSIPGGSAVADFYWTGSGAPTPTRIFVLERKVLINALSLHLTPEHPLFVGAPLRKGEPEDAISTGPIVQFTLSQDARISVSLDSTDGKPLCLYPASSGDPSRSLNLANDALNSLLIDEREGDPPDRRADERATITLSYSSDHKQGRLSASLHSGIYYLQPGPMLACEHAPAALSVSLTIAFPGFDPLVTALERWIVHTPLSGRIEAVAIDHDVHGEDIEASPGGEPPPNLHPSTRLLLRANLYCDEPTKAFNPVAEHAGRLAALLMNVKPSDILVIVRAGRKQLRIAFDPATGAPWVDPYTGGCAGAGEAPISTPVVEMFQAVASLAQAPTAFPQLVRQFVQAEFPDPARADYNFPQSAEGISIRLNCLKGAIDQDKKTLLGGTVRYWQRLDVGLGLIGLTGPRIRVEVHGAFTEGGGEGAAHCPADGQYTEPLDGDYDKALNAFALKLAERFVRFADAKRANHP
jgi:hypothetical protein